MQDSMNIAVIGQGYVGLPLALAFSKYHQVIGFDINETRVAELNSGYDRTLEISKEELLKLIKEENTSSVAIGYFASSDLTDIRNAQVYIITVPTPVDAFNTPNLQPLLSATRLVSSVLKRGDIVIYESTVYPGCTEEECVPLLERESGLTFNRDFFVGYSPERINPGDKVNTLSSVVKVTSGSTPEIAVFIDQLYKQIITAGTHLAPSIKVAEASKAIENAQRDVNISFVNELALIFDRMGIDTNEVLEAAGTKYNFLKYKPGLVGGHCISVDPYYLTYKATRLGYHPQVILSGRQVNNMIATFIAKKLIKLMISRETALMGARVLILGVTFKENCADYRNTKVMDIIRELQDFGLTVDVYDPWVDEEAFENEYSICILKELPSAIFYDGAVLAVAHHQFGQIEPRSLVKENGVIFDAKGFWDKQSVDARL